MACSNKYFLQKNSKLASNFLTEAVIGSLPRGLSLTEKELVIANTPLSPTLNLLSSLPSNLVGSRSLEGKRLRRHVMRGAVIVFITAGYSGKRFIFEKAKFNLHQGSYSIIQVSLYALKVTKTTLS